MSEAGERAKPLLDWDFHTHTVYSRHAHPDMSVLGSLRAAAAAGMKRYVILEHVPEISTRRATMQFWKHGRNERDQLDAIAADLEIHRSNFPQIQILRGVEVDADPFNLDGSAMLDDFSGIDVVVGSTHVFPGGEAFWFDRVRLPPDAGLRVAHQWREWVVRFIRAGQIHVLAHPGDLLGARQLIPPFNAPEIAGFFDPVFEAMADQGVAFELNELLQRKIGPAYRESYPDLIKHARSFGVQFSLGSDAHRTDDVGRYEWVYDLIAASGLTAADWWNPPAASA
ncbi:MAG: hypothetical protein AMXMBFR7_15400 [Planctomycetota bacterium]